MDSKADERTEQDERGGAEKGTIRLTVYAPRQTEPKHFRWDETTTVGAAAKEAAEAFRYQAGSPTFVKDGTVLDRSQTLKAAGLEDKDRVELTDVGGGV